MVVLVIGVIQGSVFYVQSMCHPPAERRLTSLNLLHEVDYLDVVPGSDVMNGMRLNVERSIITT